MYYNFVDFPENLRRIRKDRKLTQDQLAKKLEISKRTIINYENGATSPDERILQELSEALNVPLESLLLKTEYVDIQEKLKQIKKVELYEEANILNILDSERRLLQCIKHKTEFNRQIMNAPEKVQIEIASTLLNGTLNRPINEQINLINLELDMNINAAIKELEQEYQKDNSL